MFDYLTSLFEQLSFYATIVKFLLYFLVGSILLLILKKQSIMRRVIIVDLKTKIEKKRVLF